MIKSFERKMLKIFVIFAFYSFGKFAFAYDSGEVCIASSPDSITFSDSSQIDGDIIDDMLYASSGNSVEGLKEWEGFKINNPFDLPKIMAVIVYDIERIDLNEKEKCYQLTGNFPSKSYKFPNSELETSDLSIVDLDLSQKDGSLETYTGLSRKSLDELPIAESTQHLKPELHSEDKQFLKEIEWMKLVASTYASAHKQPDILYIRLPMEPVVKTHGAKSDAVDEASAKIVDAIEALRSAALKTSNIKPLIVTIASKNEHLREKRQSQAAQKESDESLNLAEYYDEDYPAIFNIILWFMVVFAFALLAICYAIGSMDPGRDSIIYRMTSTRMKKDN